MFKGTTKPDLPFGFVDCSYINGVCSHWEKEWNGYILEIWIEYDDPARRESAHQYLIAISKPGESEFEDFSEFTMNDFTEEGLRAASLKIKRELWKLMKKYY